MPELKIPPKREPGLRLLQQLSPEAASGLLAAIEHGIHGVRPDQAIAAGFPEIPGLSQADIEGILGTLLSLYRVRAGADVSDEQFLSDVCDFAQSPERGPHRIPEKATAEFRDRLSKFLSISDLVRAAKAMVLRYEHEHPLCRVRILTDARPLFPEDASAPPDAAVIFHVLKVAYHDPDRISEMFFGLDENDLETLKKAIARAEAKAQSLRNLLSTSGVKVISPE